MKKDIDKFISTLDESYYKCLLEYIAIPNSPDIAPNMHLLLVKYSNNKVKYISEQLETIRVKHNITYDEIQKYIKTNYS